ncbi:hypothetical protein [Massilia sp. erpn]|uniref:hypothetical protein n=1 Tax=Massilia sp. erpn TaxID=2738142 RepID=UPI0021034DA0|nr:hypothetical protein [Massilia sp. erpn]UTY59798.1 hypothetical protein HPQ68_23015 [Massilia sp. erpn]
MPLTLRRRIAARTRPTPILAGLLPISLIAAMVSGCSVMPNQVAGPVIKPAGTAERKAGLKAQYLLNGKSVIYDQAFDESPAIMPVETNIYGVQSQAMAMKGAYLDRQKYLLGEIDVVSNVQFAGILVSAIGVATKSNATRNAGAGAAGLSSLWGSHYSLTVQAANYGLAAEAMDCLSTEISSIAPSFWRLAYTDEGVFISTRADFVLPGASEADTNKAYDALSGMYASLHSSIGKIDLKLRSLQSKLVIPTVSVADIQDAVSGQSAAKKGADAADGKSLGEHARKLANSAQKQANQAAQNVADASKKLNAAKQVANDANVKFLKAQSDAIAINQESVDAQAALTRFDTMQKLAVDSAPATPPDQRKKLRQTQLDVNAKQAEFLVRKEAAALSKEEAEHAVSQLELDLKNLQDAAAATKKEAEDKNALADLLKLGVVGRASQVPANVHACVVAMGK